MSHSSLAPSSASIWAPANGCPGWRGMNLRYPETERSQAAEDGTAAHELAEKMVTASARAGVGFPQRDKVVGKTASNGVVWDDEMYDGAMVYNDIIKPLLQGLNVYGGPNLGIEESVTAGLSIHPMVYGTPDLYLWDQRNVTLHLYDFKYGFGPVDAFENWQLIVYAAAVIEKLHLNDPELKISLNIIQPRLYSFDGSPSQWNVTIAQLRPFIEQAQRGAHHAVQPDAPVRSGPHCKYCKARHACPAAIETGLALYETTTEAIPVNMETPAMAEALTILSRAHKHIQSLIIGFEEQLKLKAKAGEPIPGFRVEPALGYVVWDKPIGEVLKLGEMFGLDLRKTDAITPNQAKKAGLDPAIVDSFSAQPVRGVKLIADEGKHARKVFGS
jgi:hypothetical protein